MLKPFKLIWDYRKILTTIIKNDIKGRFAGSILGISWLFLYPLMFLGTYAIVFIFIYKVRLQMMTTNEYILLIFCGLIPFIGFSEALSAGVGSVVGNANLIKNTMFPIDLIPVKTVFSSQCTQIVGMAGILLVLLFWGKLGYNAIYIVPVWILQIMFSMGLLWFLSALNVFFRDLGNIISVFIMLLMMVSPIAYTEDMIPEGLKTILYFNPIYYMILLYRTPLMFNKVPPIHDIVIFTVVSFFIFFAGHFVFTRLKVVFSDYV